MINEYDDDDKKFKKFNPNFRFLHFYSNFVYTFLYTYKIMIYLHKLNYYEDITVVVM